MFIKSPQPDLDCPVLHAEVEDDLVNAHPVKASETLPQWV